MVRRQGIKCGTEILQIAFRRTDAKQAAIFLHHVDPGPAVACIDHQMQGALRTKDVVKRAQSEVRIGKVMEHAGADNQVEGASKLADVFDRKLMQLEVFQTV